MSMLHACAFPDCETLTLSAHCLEHELLIRAESETERAQDPEHHEATDRAAVAISHGAA